MHCPNCHHPITEVDAITAGTADISKWLAIIAEILAGPQDEVALREQIEKLKQSSTALDSAIQQNETKET